MAEIVYIPIQLLAVLEALVAEAVIQATTLVELQDSLEEQGMVGTELQQELTEQNAAQQAVEAERQQYQTLFNLAPDGPHGKARPGDWDSECAARAWLRDALGEAQALPQRVYDGEGAVGPGIHHAPLGGGRPHRLGSTFVQDTAGRGGADARRFGAPQRGRHGGACGPPRAFGADATRSRPAEDA